MQLFYFTLYELKKPKHRGDQYHRSQELEPGFDFKQSDSRCFGARKCTNSSGGGSDENREEALGEEGEDKALDLERTDPLTRCMTLSKLLHSLSLFPHL